MSLDLVLVTWDASRVVMNKRVVFIFKEHITSECELDCLKVLGAFPGQITKISI